MTLFLAFVVWGVVIGLPVTRWAWRWLDIYPTTTKGHLALGASAHLWPLLLAVVGATWWFRWWRDRPRRPVDPPRVHHRLGPPGRVLAPTGPECPHCDLPKGHDGECASW